MTARDVLITGGTGYVGRALVTRLVAAGHRVRVLARPASLARVAAGATPVAGDALAKASIAAALRPGDVVVQLVGTPHPGPRKAREFQAVDLASALAAIRAAAERGAAHFVYVSVAQPAPVMRAYVAARAAAEAALRAARLPATILRPWYVLGPGHRWPLLLAPVYGLARLVPAWRAGAERLGLVTLAQMTAALAAAVAAEPPPADAPRILEVPALRTLPGP